MHFRNSSQRPWNEGWSIWPCWEQHWTYWSTWWTRMYSPPPFATPWILGWWLRQKAQRSVLQHVSWLVLHFISQNVVSKIMYSRGLAAGWFHGCQSRNKGDDYSRTQVVWNLMLPKRRISNVFLFWQWWRPESQRHPFRIWRNIHRIRKVFGQYRWLFMHWTTPSSRQRRTCSSLLENASWI